MNTRSFLRLSIPSIFVIALGIIYLSGGAVASHTSQVNLALEKLAYQSSEYCDFGCGPAKRAVDGNINGDFFKGSVSHTNRQKDASWSVDLEGTYKLRKIVIWNRTDSDSNRLSNFRVCILSEKKTAVWCRAWFGNANYPMPALYIDVPSLAARYVTVRLLDVNYLSLAEVQVFPAAEH